MPCSFFVPQYLIDVGAKIRKKVILFHSELEYSYFSIDLMNVFRCTSLDKVRHAFDSDRR